MPAVHRTRSVGAALLVLLAAVTSLGAQVQLREVGVTPISTLHADWLNEGAESPNGRFFVFSSYAGDRFTRYDRNTRQWATANGVTIGAHVRWSPDGRFLAYTKFDNGVRSVWVLPMDSSTGMPRGVARKISTARASWPAWSPDGRHIAISVQDSGRFRIATVPFNGGDETVLYETRGVGGDLAWSPDRTYIWAGHGVGNQARYWLRVNTSTRRVDSFPIGPVRMLGYSADGRYVAHHDPGTPAVVISSATDGRAVQRLALPPRVRPTGWSKSSPNALSAIQHVVPAHVERVSLADGSIESLTPVDSATGPGGAVRYSPDGRQIAYATRLGGAFQLRIANSDGSGARNLGARGDIGQYRWSPSGKHIAYPVQNLTSDGGLVGGIRLLEVASGVDRELVGSRNTSASGGNNIGWRSDGQAIRYVWFPRGLRGGVREVREARLDGADRRITTLASMEGEPHFINDTLLVLRKGTGMEAVNLRTGASKPLYSGSMRAWNEPGISPDGSWLVFSADANGAAYPQLVSLRTGETRRVPYSLKGELAQVFFHPDGRNLVASACITCSDPFVEKWDVVIIPMNGDAPRVLTASQSSYKDFGMPQISPDGKHVVFEAEQSYNTRVVTLTFPKP